jgi:hypothetical protein
MHLISFYKDDILPFLLESNFPWLWPSGALCSCGGSPIPAGIQPDAGLCPRALYLLIQELTGVPHEIFDFRTFSPNSTLCLKLNYLKKFEEKMYSQHGVKVLYRSESKVYS